MHETTRILMEEHAQVRRMLKVIRSLCISVMQGGDVDQAEFASIIDFIRRYADSHHHGKEEKILFPVMVEKLGRIGETMVTHGMLVEHSLGRSHVHDLADALEAFQKDPGPSNRLDILESAMGYARLLGLHVDKEDTVVYPLAERMLAPELWLDIDHEVKVFDEQEEKLGVRTKYLSFLEAEERKWGLV